MKGNNRTTRTSHEISIRAKKSLNKFVTDKTNIAPNDDPEVIHELRDASD